jgi:hypothetical protein
MAYPTGFLTIQQDDISKWDFFPTKWYNGQRLKLFDRASDNLTETVQSFIDYIGIRRELKRTLNKIADEQKKKPQYAQLICTYHKNNEYFQFKSGRYIARTAVEVNALIEEIFPKDIGTDVLKEDVLEYPYVWFTEIEVLIKPLNETYSIDIETAKNFLAGKFEQPIKTVHVTITPGMTSSLFLQYITSS